MPARAYQKVRTTGSYRRKPRRRPSGSVRVVAQSAWVLMGVGVLLAIASGFVKGSEFGKLLSAKFIKHTGALSILLSIAILIGVKRKWFSLKAEPVRRRRKTK